MRNYFRGWYIKCQSGTHTVAFIPAYHITDGVKSCSLQIITDDGAWNVQYPFGEFHMDNGGVRVGDNVCTRRGCHLNARNENISVTGDLEFGVFTPIAYDIMGPFQFVPFMECRHSVLSMKHRVDGRVSVNGREYGFTDGVCYIEGDRGRSFPKEYLWTQCGFENGSLMLSVADIPFCRLRFTGVISVIHYRGREYRLATYLGARAVKIGDGEVVIRQGRRILIARRMEDNGHPLAAPVSGDMKRTIRESASCRCYYHFQENGKTIFSFFSDQASFEYEYPR